MRKGNPKGSVAYSKRGGKPYKDIQKLINEGLAEAGILNSDIKGKPRAIYKYASNETVITNPGGASITLGLDRPDSRGSGYGSRGFTGLQPKSIGSSRIDLVVGRMASANKAEGVPPGTYVDNNFFADAARIYICETTDVDQNFGLVEGVVGNPKAVSTVAIKSDQTRIIGRTGIKLVTGGGNNVKGFGLRGETNSKGAKLPVAGGIDMIAGNIGGDRFVWNPWNFPETLIDLQPVAKSYNVRDYLAEISALRDDLYSVVLNHNVMLGAIFTIISNLPGTYTLIPFSFASILLMIIHSIIAIIAQFIIQWDSQGLYHSRAQNVAVDFDYLQHAGYKFIGSRSIRVT